MTFLEDMAVLIEAKRSVNNIGHALRELLIRANKADRLVVGVMESVQILQSNPDEVSLCILTKTDDVTAQIHHKLVEAFCWENDIEVVKVEESTELKKVLGRNGSLQNVGAIDCILIQSDGSDAYTNAFMENYYTLLACAHSPTIDLPE